MTSDQSSASTTYDRPNGYESYVATGDNISDRNQPNNTHLSSNTDVSACASSTYPDPRYPYQTPYATNTPAFTTTSYTSNDGLPATAAAADAYLNNYPSQSAALSSHYSSSLATTGNGYAQYHSPGSPTSWRNWAGNMAHNLEPNTEYMTSASALIQLGGRTEGAAAQDFTVEGSAAQGWPFMIFDGGSASGP